MILSICDKYMVDYSNIIKTFILCMRTARLPPHFPYTFLMFYTISYFIYSSFVMCMKITQYYIEEKIFFKKKILRFSLFYYKKSLVLLALRI